MSWVEYTAAAPESAAGDIIGPCMGFPIGRLFGTDIRATGGFFLLMAAAFYFQGDAHVAQAAIFCIAIIVSLLVHEFGHVFAVRWQLHSESAVILWGLGGLCVHPPAETPKQRIIISLMGPAFQAVLGGAAVAAYFWAPAAQPYLWALVLINVFWLVLNLLPILPLDGGHALEAILQTRLGEAKASRVARRVSVVTAGVLLVASLYLDLMFVGIMAAFLMLQNFQGPSTAS
jgi:Zn-dependent protease